MAEAQAEVKNEIEADVYGSFFVKEEAKDATTQDDPTVGNEPGKKTA